MIVNYIKIEKITDLYQIFDESIFLSGDVSQFQKEIFANSWGITVDHEFAKTINIDELAKFILDLIEFETKQISMMRPSIKATLYFWFDELSLQLCFNTLSGADRKLPFGCKINILDSPYPILKKFLKVAYNNAFYDNYLEVIEIRDVDKEHPIQDDDNFDIDNFVIDVWKITLPWDDEKNI